MIRRYLRAPPSADDVAGLDSVVLCSVAEAYDLSHVADEVAQRGLKCAPLLDMYENLASSE